LAAVLVGLIEQALATGADSDERRNVVSRLQRRHDRSTFDAALALCRSEDPQRRVLGVEILAQLGYEQSDEDRPFREPTITLLLELAETEHTVSVLSAIGRAFGHLRAARAIDVLVCLGRHQSESVRSGAVEGLLGQDDDRAVDALVALSSDVAAPVRDWATFGLGSLIDRDTAQVRDALMARLGDADPDTRGEALVGLAARGDHRAIEPLLAELDEYEGTLLNEALELLITRTGDQRLLDARDQPS
jgi:HEAT repeat protein